MEEYFFEIRFKDPGYNAMVHFAATFTCNNIREAQSFYDELSAGFERRGVVITMKNCFRIDNDPLLKQNYYQFHQQYLRSAKAQIQIAQFQLSNPDQDKSLIDNMTDKFFNGEDSTAYIGRTYSLPVRVLDEDTRNPITDEIYYFSVEHLIPKK